MSASNLGRVKCDPGGFECKHCKGRRNFTLPMDIEAFIAYGQAFAIEHRNCKPSKPPKKKGASK